MTRITPEGLANAFVMERSKMESLFNLHKAGVEKALEEYKKGERMTANTLFGTHLGPIKCIPNIVEKNGFTDAESIMAEAKKLDDEARSAAMECESEAIKMLEEQLISEAKRAAKRKRRMEETNLADRLEKALRFKEELETKIREEKN